MKYLRRFAAAFVIVAGFIPVARAGDYQDLLKRLPESTNVIVVADVKELGKALAATPGNPLKTAGITSLPIMASKFVVGAHLDLSMRRHVWSVGLVQLDHKLPIEDIAAAENEKVEKLGDYSVVPSKRNSYFVDMGPDLLGVRTPANRQELKTWLAEQKSNRSPERSPYLQQALDPATPALMIMAIDLSDSLDPSAILRGLNNSKVMAARRNPNYAAVAKTLEALEGVSLYIRPGEPLNGELFVHFKTKIEPIKNYAVQLLLEALQNTGLYVRDFQNWDGFITDTFVRIKGPLSLQSLRKFGALIKTPAPNPSAADMSSYQAMSVAQRGLVSSQLYFKSVSKFLEDLKADKSRDDKALAGWYDQYADQIDKLPILDVDPELVDYAGSVSQDLRAMSAAFTGLSLQRGYLQKKKQLYVGNSYTPYYGWQGVSKQLTDQQEELIAQSGEDRAKLSAKLDDATAEIRRKMTRKFMTEF
jgi:hypothetical protein